MSSHLSPVLAAILFFAAVVLPAETNLSKEKADYHWLNPTPDALLRALSPDRPDATESPVTVDAGHYVWEVSVADWRRNDGDETVTLLASNFKVGLTPATDLQIVFDAYQRVNPEGGASTEGFGDVQLRLKYNLWGNDGGRTAFALFPYIKIPTGTRLSNEKWEGGLILPLSVELSDTVGLGLMAEVDWVYNDSDNRHVIEFLHSAVIGFDLTERLGTFIEYIGITGEDPYQAYAAGGFTYGVNENLVLDFGLQAGLSDTAEDIAVFAGFTRRF